MEAWWDKDEYTTRVLQVFLINFYSLYSFFILILYRIYFLNVDKNIVTQFFQKFVFFLEHFEDSFYDKLQFVIKNYKKYRQFHKTSRI